MSFAFLTKLFCNSTRLFSRQPKKLPKTRFVPSIQQLEERAVFAVVATFSPSGQSLAVFGDSSDNNIDTSRNAAGGILVNGGAVSVLGGSPTVANAALIQLFGLGGNDTITLNEANGALPRALLFGGSGNDTLTGGSGADQIFGQAGNDTLFGKSGVDVLFGGTENDSLTSGDADDHIFGESINDRMIWNPEDDTDLNEGGTRDDKLTINALAGDDAVEASGLAAGAIQLTADGGIGHDVLIGSAGADVLIGGEGDDVLIGGDGLDVLDGGPGDDVEIQ